MLLLLTLIVVLFQVFGVFWSRALYRRFTMDYKDTNTPDRHSLDWVICHTHTHIFNRRVLCPSGQGCIYYFQIVLRMASNQFVFNVLHFDIGGTVEDVLFEVYKCKGCHVFVCFFVPTLYCNEAFFFILKTQFTYL